VLAQTSGTSSAGSAVGVILYVAVVVLEIVAMWTVFTKAGRPGWASIVPIYNLYVLLKVAGREGWWIVLFLIPLVNVVVWFIVAIDLAKCFGKTAGFGVGIALLSFVFIPILAFGDARYLGPAPSSGPIPAAPPPPPPLGTYPS
jgi:uncharacterized protein DUF5684